MCPLLFFFFQAEDGIRDSSVTGVQTCALPISLEYAVTIEDPTVWTRPWTAKVGFTKQSDEQNRIYYEPRCNEGNFGLPGLLHGRRMEEHALAEGRGPDPATRDSIKAVVRDVNPLE